MIRRSAAGILIPLLLMYGVACYSYNAAKVKDIERIDWIEKAKIMTIDDKLYILADVTIEDSYIKGVIVPSHSKRLRRNIQDGVIVISSKEIKEIAVQEYDGELTALAGSLVIVIGGPLIYLFVLISLTNINIL